MNLTRRKFFKISGILAGLAVLNPVKICQAIGKKEQLPRFVPISEYAKPIIPAYWTGGNVHTFESPLWGTSCLNDEFYVELESQDYLRRYNIGASLNK